MHATEIAHMISTARWQQRPPFNQNELADALGCTPAYVTMLEKGRSQPSPKMAWKLERALGLPEGTLLQRVIAARLGTRLKSSGKSRQWRSISSHLLRGSEQMPSNPETVMAWTTNKHGRVSYLNEAWLKFTGMLAADQLGMGWTELIHKDDFPEIVRKRLQAHERREPFVMTYRLRDRNGTYRVVVDSGNPRYNQDGEFDGYSGSCVVANNDVNEK